jgi:hypothetical protein
MEHIITVFIFIATVVVGYFSVVREHENRIVRLETRLDSINEMMSEMRADIKELLKRDKT